MTLSNPFLHIHPEVQAAIAGGQPVVALESTIIAHGMPFPQNLETAQMLEAEVRRGGAIPATVAVLAGKICVGLEADQLAYLAQAPDVAKASRRDLPAYLAQGRAAATTVAATMIGAHLAGIRVFATGGIGGVHRGASQTFDISADLQELARTPVAVVSAGAKSILDLGLTLEYLETQGVPVIGYQTDRFPAFFTRDSGYPVPLRLDGPAEIAQALHAQWALGLGGGALIANPIPVAYDMEPSRIEAVIAQAVAAAEAAGIHGKDLTPFLLDTIRRETGGDSLAANIALVQHNVHLATAIAVDLAKLGR